MSGIATKYEDLITADHKILKVKSESRCGHRNAVILQDDVTNWIQSSPMKNEINIGYYVVFTKISHSLSGYRACSGSSYRGLQLAGHLIITVA